MSSALALQRMPSKAWAEPDQAVPNIERCAEPLWQTVVRALACSLEMAAWMLAILPVSCALLVVGMIANDQYQNADSYYDFPALSNTQQLGAVLWSGGFALPVSYTISLSACVGLVGVRHMKPVFVALLVCSVLSLGYAARSVTC